MQSKPTAVLLAIIALLLAANLVVNLPPQEATAQSHLKTAAPHVIQVETLGPGPSSLVFRLWSDGVIEEAMFEDVNFDANAGCVPGVPGMAWQVIPETVPLPHAVNITRIYTGPHFSIRVLRLRSDGVVEQNDKFGSDWCGWRTLPE